MKIIIAEVVGNRHIQYTNKQGKEINGVEYHFLYEDDDIIGKAAGSCFISLLETAGQRFDIGDHLNMVFDPYGKRRFNYLPR